MMQIFNIYIFDRKGTCLFYREWRRERAAGGLSRREEERLLFGMLLSLGSFAGKLSPTEAPQALRGFTTSKYRLNFLETPTGLKFVLNTQPKAPYAQDLLRSIYSQIFVPCVVKNPLYKAGEPITSELFSSSLDDLIDKHNTA